MGREIEDSVDRSVWRGAVAAAEEAVLCLTPTPPGGRRHGESVEAYVQRTRELQDEALAQLRHARGRLARVERRREARALRRAARESHDPGAQ